MGLKVTNNAFGTLNASINSSATTIVLVAGQGARFPTLSAGDYFYATLIDTSNNLEIVKCTARSTDTLTVVRAQDNTTGRAYATNDRFELRPTAILFNEKANDADVTTALATKFDKSGGTLTGMATLSMAGAVSNRFLRLTDTSASGVSWDLINRYGNTAGQFAIYDATNDRGVIAIDAAGRMTTPYQPAFEAVFTSGYVIGSGTTMVPSIVNLNRGGHYNSSNGRFTAPVTGAYLIAANIRYVSSYYSWTFNVNGNVIRYFESSGPGSPSSTNDGYAFVKSLAAGDYVTLVTGSAGISSDGYASFSGILLG